MTLERELPEEETPQAVVDDMNDELEGYTDPDNEIGLIDTWHTPIPQAVKEHNARLGQFTGKLPPEIKDIGRKYTEVELLKIKYKLALQRLLAAEREASEASRPTGPHIRPPGFWSE